MHRKSVKQRQSETERGEHLHLQNRPAIVDSRKNLMIAIAVVVAAAEVAAAVVVAAAQRRQRCRWPVVPPLRHYHSLPTRRQRQRPLQRPPQKLLLRFPPAPAPSDGSLCCLSTVPSSARTWVCYSRALGITVNSVKRTKVRTH